MHERRVTARLHRSGYTADDATATAAEWPLDTLVAFLFEGRECDEVRALLSRGEGEARGTALTWEPVDLSVDEFSAIERRFPQGDEPRPLDRRRAVAVALTVPALHPTLSIPIRADHPLVAVAASRAAYLRFDYGPWADVYVATLTRAEAAELLDDPARRGNDTGEAELAKRIIGEDDAALRFTVPREDQPPPWEREPNG
ncbi:MAG TPA: hypothetical protein VFS44_03740 [Gemmatimonadaceae bacterium]|nr:hypothetical protein [Gemmatimonadaceae bacterium]